jgi:hypothetical protein
MVDPPPDPGSQAPQWSSDGGSTVPMRGFLPGGSTIALVPEHATRATAQILSAVIGGLGAAFFGAGLGPLVSQSTPLPVEAIRAIADTCAKTGAHCDTLQVGQTHIGTALLVVGVAMIGIQVYVLFRGAVAPVSNQSRTPAPSAPPDPPTPAGGSHGAGTSAQAGTTR